MSELQPNPSSRPIQSIVLGVILILLLLAVFRLFAPFFTVLLWTTLLYIMIYPLHRRVIRKIGFGSMKGKILRSLWAVVFTLGTMVIVLFPISMVISLFFRQTMELARTARDLLNEKPEYLHGIFEKFAGIIKEISAGQIDINADEIARQLRTFITTELQRVVFLSSNIAKHIGSFSFSMLLMVFTLYFFYVDGPYLSRLVLSSIPIKREYIRTLTTKFLDITRNLFFGYIFVAALQSAVAFIIYTLFGVKGTLVLAVLTFLLVFIPVIGSTIIWIPLGILKIAGGDITGGVLFMVVSMIFISGIDNVLRPFFLKDRIQLHPLIIFFAILGGLSVFGFNGFILGPVLVILFLTVLDLFLTEHKIGNKE
jgi:predicted PurR-regulated permease PerM